jgi:archaellin
MLVVIFFGAIAYHDQQRCENFRSFHPVRFIVQNHYDRPIWVNIEFSSIPETDSWMINENSNTIVYTKHTFGPDSNVTVTLHPIDPDTGQRLDNNEDVTVQITPNLHLVYDDNYHKDLEKRDSTVDIQCVTDQVYEGPTITLWPTQ